MAKALCKAFSQSNGEFGQWPIVSTDDPVSREIVKCLKDWHFIWANHLYVRREIELFEKIGAFINDLIDWRRQMLAEILTQEQLKELKLKITQHIDLGNRLLGLDLVPRFDSQIVDPELITPIELYRVHQESSAGLSSSPRASNSSANTVPVPSVHSFLYLHIRDLCFPPANFEDNFEFSFFLYDYASSTQISEKYVVRISGTKQDISKSNFTTVFSNLSKVSDELYLLIQAQRVGKMLIAENKSSKSSSSSTLPPSIHATYSSARFKRPFGSAILNVSEFLKSECMDKECTLKLFCSNNESDFFQVHDMLYKKQPNKLAQVQNSSISLYCKFLIGSEANKVIYDNPLIFQNVCCLTSKMGFPDIIMPGDVRNDLYMVLESGEFEKGGKSIPKNIEASVSLYSADGKPIINSISYGSGAEAICTFVSQVFYHNNNPRWMESLKVLIPLEVFDLKAHIRIEFRHCSTKENQSNKEKDKNFLGFSFIPLSDDQGTIIKDGDHELFIYKFNDSSDTRNRLKNPMLYLTLPYGPKDERIGMRIDSLPLYRSHKESVHVRTLLCSTKLTQNSDLLSLLKWRSNPETVHQALSKVKNLNGEEIVKFLQDILDALFSMFSTHDGNYTHHSALVFNVLLDILSLLENPKYEHFKPVLDTYINGHFAAALVYKGLISSVKHSTELIRDSDSQHQIQTCFRSLEWIFKFIVQSRILYARATGDHSNEDCFKQELFGMFNSFKKMLSLNYDTTLVDSQVAFIDNFTSTYSQLLRVLVPEELTKIIQIIIDCLPCLEPWPQIIRSKLRCIHNTIQNEMLLRDYEARRELITMVSSHLKEHINRQQELKLCSQIISDILIFLHNEKISIASGTSKAISSGSNISYGCNISQEVDILVKTLLEPIVRVIVDLSTTTGESSNVVSISHLHSYVSSFMTLLRLMDESHYVQLLERKNRKEKKEFLLQVFYVFKQIFQPEMYQPDWSVMKMTSNHIILCSLQEFSVALTEDFLGFEKGSFDVQLWNSFFNLSVSFLTQSSLQLETFSQSKREAILHKYQDMRVLMGFLILSMWEKLGTHKGNFIPSMVAPFLEVTLVPEKELRKATLPIFYDLIDADYRLHGNFKQVESKLIDKLDILVSDYRGDEEFKQLFNTIILEKINQQSPMWKEQGIQMIHSITKLLELLLDYRSVMNGEENANEKMCCTVNLLNFYKDEINRKEMYVRYIYKLCDLHLPVDNYAEAAFTLELHADLLNWSWLRIDGPQYPNEPLEWQRKEALYLAIIDYFDRGKCWEEGISLIKELAEFYEKKLFDYQKLSNLLKKEASFFDNILTQLRPEPEYFRVAFYGKGFPIFLRNKVFVYRGLEYEKIAAFTARLQAEFSQSQLMTKNSPPDKKILESQEQYIQICNVKPVPEPRNEFHGKEVPEKVLSYYLVNDVKTFTFDRPVHKGIIDKENEFKSLWIERTVLRINGKLPGILRCCEVKEKPQIYELSPVQHARETIENMNKELQKLIASYTSEPTKALSPLTMRLQGVIEAAVNGGIGKYHDAFFDSEYIAANQSQLKNIKLLKQAILQQVKILEGGLSLHGRLVPQDVKPLHKRLVERFTIMRQTIIEKSSGVFGFKGDEGSRKASIIYTPLPPLPFESKTASNSQIYKPNDDLDQIYSIPIDKVTPPIPERHSHTPPPPIPPSRPRSAGFQVNFSNEIIPSPPRPTQAHPNIVQNQIQRSRSIPRSQMQAPLTHSLSLNNPNTELDSPVPPLPPRSAATLERNKSAVTISCYSKEKDQKQPQFVPKRAPVKISDSTLPDNPLFTPIEAENESHSLTSYDRSIPPMVSPLLPPTPPPLPAKKVPSESSIKSSTSSIANGELTSQNQTVLHESKDEQSSDKLNHMPRNGVDHQLDEQNQLATIIKIDLSNNHSENNNPFTSDSDNIISLPVNPYSNSHSTLTVNEDNSLSSNHEISVNSADTNQTMNVDDEISLTSSEAIFDTQQASTTKNHVKIENFLC